MWTSRPGLSSQQGEVRQGVGPVQPPLVLLLLHLLHAVHVDPRGRADGDGDPRRGRRLSSPSLQAALVDTHLNRGNAFLLASTKYKETI